MANQKTQKFELAKLDANNIVELDGWKEKQQTIIKENPFVKIVDRETYEIAKTRRTALVSARTEIQKQDKLIASVMSKFRKGTIAMAKELIDMTVKHEEKQQIEVSRHETILEEKRHEKELEEENRIESIKKSIEGSKRIFKAILDLMTVENIDERISEFELNVIDESEKDFEEFEPMFDDVVSDFRIEFKNESARLNHLENLRLEQLVKDQESEMNKRSVSCQNVIDQTDEENQGFMIGMIEKIMEKEFDFGGFQEQLNENYRLFLDKANKKIEAIKAETERRKEIQLQENKNRINNVREGLLDKIFQMTVDEHDVDFDYINESLQQENPFPELQDQFDAMIQTVQKNLDSKMKMINAEKKHREDEIVRGKAEKEKQMNERVSVLVGLGLTRVDGEFKGFGLEYKESEVWQMDNFDGLVDHVKDWKTQIEEIRVRTENRGKQLEKIGFKFNKQTTESFWNNLITDHEVWMTMVEGQTDEDWNDYFKALSEAVESSKAKNKAFKKRQTLLANDKKIMIIELQDLSESFVPSPGDYENDESFQLAKEIHGQLDLFVKTKIETINKF